MKLVEDARARQEPKKRRQRGDDNDGRQVLGEVALVEELGARDVHVLPIVNLGEEPPRVVDVRGVAIIWVS